MRKPVLTAVLLILLGKSFAQETELPPDFRQHNLTLFNSNLFNPTFSFDRNSPRSAALWSRWQWQNLDGDPTTLFFNYSQKISPILAGGLGFLQQNTGIYLQRGANLNLGWKLALDEKTALFLGSNIFIFGQELANEQQIPSPDVNPVSITSENSFAMQLSPGIRLSSGSFNAGLSLQSAINLALSGPDANSTDVVQGFVSNDFPLRLFASEAILRPQAYVRAVSDFDTQVGILALLRHPNFWAQGGYNSFYGPSLGIGVTVAKTISVGGLMEFATGDLSNEDATFELVLSYSIGKQSFVEEPVDDFEPIPESLPAEEEALSKRQRRRLEKRRLDSIEQAEKAATLLRMEKRRMDSINTTRVKERSEQVRDSIAQAKSKKAALDKEQEEKEPDTEKQEVLKDSKPKPLSKRQQRRLEKRRLDSIEQAEKAAALIRSEKRRMDSINTTRVKERREQEIRDSIAQAKSREIALVKEQARLDSIAAVELKKDVDLLPNERYEEVRKGEGLEPGFYLIANVFGTKKYYENFMRTLKGMGLSPGSFYRKANGYNYVYLKRYNSINEARQARDSKFDGRYQDKLWIFRIR